MTKRGKLIVRFKSFPKDFEWSELVRLLSEFGYEPRDGRGSRRKFVCEGRATIVAHEPHPKPVVKIYLLKQIASKLEEEGLI